VYLPSYDQDLLDSFGRKQSRQILDGLKVREDSWRKTADCFRSGYSPDDSFAIEECNDEHEANRIAEFYSRIIRDVERQRDEQRV
jgi:hypothetical protein